MDAACPVLRVLVVDDRPDNADALALLIHHFGAEVRAVYEAHAAIQAARSLRPHVVFLDVVMPRKDGFAIAQELRALPGMGSAQIIAVTGLSSAVTDQRKEPSIDLILRKPMDLNVLRAILLMAAKRLRNDKLQ